MKVNTYVEISRDKMEEYLRGMGFTREDTRGEIVYFKLHEKNPALILKIYTSIAEHGAGVRAKGVDAIRVVALLTWKRQDELAIRRKVLYQAKILRVNSADGVLARIREKAREAYAACNEFNNRGWR
jgi:hypothetical protein